MTPSNSFGAETPSIITNETVSAYEESVQEKGLQKTSHLKRQIITAEETLQVEQRKLANLLLIKRSSKLMQRFSGK